MEKSNNREKELEEEIEKLRESLARVRHSYFL